MILFPLPLLNILSKFVLYGNYKNLKIIQNVLSEGFPCHYHDSALKGKKIPCPLFWQEQVECRWTQGGEGKDI